MREDLLINTWALHTLSRENLERKSVGGGGGIFSLVLPAIKKGELWLSFCNSCIAKKRSQQNERKCPIISAQRKGAFWFSRKKRKRGLLHIRMGIVKPPNTEWHTHSLTRSTGLPYGSSDMCITNEKIPMQTRDWCTSHHIQSCGNKLHNGDDCV